MHTASDLGRRGYGRGTLAENWLQNEILYELRRMPPYRDEGLIISINMRRVSSYSKENPHHKQQSSQSLSLSFKSSYHNLYLPYQSQLSECASPTSSSSLASQPRFPNLLRKTPLLRPALLAASGSSSSGSTRNQPSRVSASQDNATTSPPTSRPSTSTLLTQSRFSAALNALSILDTVALVPLSPLRDSGLKRLASMAARRKSTRAGSASARTIAKCV